MICDKTTNIEMPEDFLKLMIATNAHLGGTKISKSMEDYVFDTRNDGIKVFDLNLVWEKFVLAARAICGIELPYTINAVSCKLFGRKAVLKFAETTNTKACTGRFIPGSFTNNKLSSTYSPRLVIVSDPISDKQAVLESSMINCPVIAFCNTECELKYVDIAIPLNNRSPKAIGVSFFILGRLVRFMKHQIPMDLNLKEVELSFYRFPAELEKLQEEQSENIHVDSLINNMKSEQVIETPSNLNNENQRHWESN